MTEDTGEKNLPSGYRSVEKVSQKHKLSGLDWLRDGVGVSLSMVTLDTGQKYLLGSAVAHNHGIKELADKLQPNESESARTTFYAKVGEFINNGGCCRGVNQINSPRTQGATVFYAKSRTDMRTYFIWDGRSNDGVPIIIRVGVCRKSQQPKLMGIISKY